MNEEKDIKEPADMNEFNAFPSQNISNPSRTVSQKSSAWKWFWISIMVCFVVCVLFLFLFLKGVGNFIAGMTENLVKFEKEYNTAYSESAPESSILLNEVLVQSGPVENKILIINLQGTIMDSNLFSDKEFSTLDLLNAQLQRASKDERVRAVILRIDSPGGDAFLCDLIASKLKEFYETTGKPIVSCIESMGASGGYYISAPCQWIVAHELSLTGSIGVISSSFNYSGLLSKIGVKPVIYKSGKLKDMLRASKTEEEILPEERQLMQSIIDTMYNRFKTVIREGRNQNCRQELEEARFLAENWEEYADGRIILGKDAFQIGLVDELGGMEEAFATAKRLAKIDKAQQIRYDTLMGWRDLLKFFSKAESQGIKVNIDALGIENRPEMEPGKMYFLPITD